MGNNGNQYFEQVNRMQGELTEEAMIARMGECTAILGDMTKGIAWKALLADVRRVMKNLDDNWQHIPPNDAKFESARVMKMALSMIADFPGKYAEELRMIEQELQKMKNPDNIIKDADPD